MNDTQRGVIILDKSSYETSLQGLSREFRLDGHRWGQLHNIAETPLFVDSRATQREWRLPGDEKPAAEGEEMHGGTDGPLPRKPIKKGKPVKRKPKGK